MSEIKVSVIIPVYNMQQYLEKCLNSVLEQTLKGIEVICIDDGSTDGSLNILKKYEEENACIVLWVQENQGSGPARNVGIDLARGEFIAFMDPDDYYAASDILEYLVRFQMELHVGRILDQWMHIFNIKIIPWFLWQ